MSPFSRLKPACTASALAVIFACALALAAPVPAFALRDWNIDPETGLPCVSSDCQFVRPRNNNKCICKKVWPDNDRRQAVQLECFQKSGGRWITC